MAVTKQALTSLFLLLAFAISNSIQAAVLPEERADLMYHSYSGGGITIDGPSLLVRKNFANKVSASANYYVDTISSASIDVQTSGASRYSEERTETSLAFDVLGDKNILSAGYTNSEENDYEADTYFLSISQDFFGDLSTLSLGYSFGDDVIYRTEPTGGASDFGEAERQKYRIGLSQILTPNMTAGFTYELITDEGTLNNPYRFIRYSDGSGGWLSEPERYPNTRTSDSLAVRLQYYLPYRAALLGEYRWFTDTWGIDAHTYKLEYTHPIKDHWITDFRIRYYSQSASDFYQDLFSRTNETLFAARDKEMSTFSTFTLGFSVGYEMALKSSNIFEKASINLQWDHIRFEYDDFRDARKTNPAAGINAGDEALYAFNANVIKLFFSIWY